MALVSLEQDKKYRRAGERYAEVCIACRSDREANAVQCACGATFAKPTSNFFKLAWKPTELKPVMPELCPHCDRATERVRSISLTLPTKYGGSGSATSRITIEFGTCRRVPPPYLMWLAFVTCAFFPVTFGLMVLFGHFAAAVPLAVAVIGLLLSWRAYGWLRFARFDHRSIRLRARRPRYAHALAEQNDGRVL